MMKISILVVSALLCGTANAAYTGGDSVIKEFLKHPDNATRDDMLGRCGTVHGDDTETYENCIDAVKEAGKKCPAGQILCAGKCVSTPVCGNGTLECGEQCDDGNTADGDDCSSACKNTLCKPDSCNMHGSCKAEGSKSVCVCSRGYAGEKCEECARGYKGYPNCVKIPPPCKGPGCIKDPCDPDPCNGFGQCTSEKSCALCECDEFHTGSRCETELPPPPMIAGLGWLFLALAILLGAGMGAGILFLVLRSKKKKGSKTP